MTKSLAQILSLVCMGLALATSTYVVWGSWILLQDTSGTRPSRSPASLESHSITRPGTNQTISVVSLDEVLVNVPAAKGNQIETLGIRLELELFDESAKSVIEHRQAGIRHAVIETSYGQNSDTLRTLGGKLHFKETLVSRLNSFLGHPLVRDIHFSSFLIQ